MTRHRCCGRPRYSLETKKVICEFLGSTIFILTISMSASLAGDMAPVAIGFMLTCMVFTFGYISGGHFNPAVTLGIYRIGQIESRLAWRYVLAQCGGGICAAVLAWLLLENGGNDILVPPCPNPTLGIPDPSFAAILRAVFSETFFTAVLVVVVLHVACGKNQGNQFYGLAIGMAVLSSAYAVGRIDGAGFNPAVAIGLHFQKLVSRLWLMDHMPVYIQYLPIYIFAPLIGSFLAVWWYEMSLQDDEQEMSIETVQESSTRNKVYSVGGVGDDDGVVMK